MYKALYSKAEGLLDTILLKDVKWNKKHVQKGEKNPALYLQAFDLHWNVCQAIRMFSPC